MSLFTTHRTFLQIFLVSKLFCTNTYQVELEILRNSSTIFRSSHRRCSIKNAIIKHFVIFTEKHLCCGLFFNNVAGHQACNFIGKGTPRQIYSCKNREICKKTYFEENLRMASFLESVL